MENHLIEEAFGTYFSTEIHRPFTLAGSETAAVLVHGFPGTPAETRALGERLNAGGLTTRGILLPGFGPEINHLFEKVQADWIEATVSAVNEFKKSHANVFLIGYSFGGSVAVQAALQTDIAGLVLAAPFWRIGGRRERLIWGVMRRIFPSFRPFRSMDFSKPQIRAGLAKMMPGLDLEDAGVQAGLKELRMPASIVDEIMGLGATAMAYAGDVRAPVLVVQGVNDEIINPAYSRALAAAFTPPAAYHEVSAGHNLIEPVSPTFEDVSGIILNFIQKMTV